MIKKTIAVIGLGYVGLPLLHLLTKKKINCLGFDIDIKKLNLLKKNVSYISDLSNKDLKIINKRNLYSMKEVQFINKASYIIFCLPSPLKKGNKPDLSMILDAFKKINKYLKKNQTIILESTVYPGATRKIFHKSLSKKFSVGKNFFYGYSSERVSPGQTDKKQFKYFLENIPKVISGYDKKSLNKINDIYKIIFKSVFCAESIEIAEMSKLVENSYRAVNIGLANELKTICHKLKININQVLSAAKTKPFGFNAFYPGPGVGGHCIPIDPVFIEWIAKINKVDAKFINLARSTNLNITKWVTSKIFEYDSRIKNKKYKTKILLIGLAYKADVNDVRESPSLKIYKSLIKKNNIVDFHDTKIKKIKIFSKMYYSQKINQCSKYDYVIITTDHSDLNKKVILSKSKKIFDTRGVFGEVKSKKIINL